MKNLWRYLGQVAFWILLPFLFIYLLLSKRTRVLIIADDSVLLVKGWLGTGKWDLPGGGLHKNEDIFEGALREVREETSLELKKRDLKKLSNGIYNNYGLRYHYILFVTQLPLKPAVHKQRIELVDIVWLSMDDINENNCDRLVIEAVAAWRKSQNLVQ